MPNTKPLTKAERAWLEEVQAVLDRCPSKRLGFFTIGDPNVMLHDATREDEIGEELEKNGGDWCSAAHRIGADFDGVSLDFPGCVHSTAG